MHLPALSKRVPYTLYLSASASGSTACPFLDPHLWHTHPVLADPILHLPQQTFIPIMDCIAELDRISAALQVIVIAACGPEHEVS